MKLSCSDAKPSSLLLIRCSHSFSKTSLIYVKVSAIDNNGKSQRVEIRASNCCSKRALANTVCSAFWPQRSWGIAATKPGNTANDVAQKFWKVLDKYNIKKESRTGYSIGIGYPPDWGEHTLNISKGDKTILQPNVTFHMIAVMQFGEWGVEASEAIRITDKGCELFCNFSKDLHIK